ncbi:hypothetical protein [Novosphingobium terrae]|nr:hypothetical protein [Novosphingobium terrae]
MVQANVPMLSKAMKALAGGEAVLERQISEICDYLCRELQQFGA